MTIPRFVLNAGLICLTLEARHKFTTLTDRVSLSLSVIVFWNVVESNTEHENL